MRCIACGSGPIHVWRPARPADPRASSTSYVLVRCAECRSASIAGRSKDDRDQLYSAGPYQRPPALVDFLLEPLRRIADRGPLGALSDLPPGAKVLEVGSGDGRLVDLLIEQGCDARGIEPYVAERGEHASAGRAEDLEPESERYDAILFWHVLEHLDDPAGVVARAAQALRPGGRIVVSVPILDSLQANIGRDRWFHQDLPRHRTLFTRRGLVRLLERSGLRVVSTRGLVLDQSLLGMAQTLLNFATLRRNVGFRLLKRDLHGISTMDIVAGSFAAPVAIAAALVLEPLAMAARRGGAIVVHAVAR